VYKWGTSSQKTLSFISQFSLIKIDGKPFSVSRISLFWQSPLQMNATQITFNRYNLVTLVIFKKYGTEDRVEQHDTEEMMNEKEVQKGTKKCFSRICTA
jgi:hypothetical protein